MRLPAAGRLPPARRLSLMRRVLAMCGGFLFAVLWFDLMFDVQVLPYPTATPLPEAVLASIAAYYRRALIDSYPMSRLIALVMIVTLGGSIWQIVRRRVPRWHGLAALAFAAAPIVLAGARVVSAATRLGTRSDTVEVQSALAHMVARDHLFCLASIAVFIALQLWPLPIDTHTP